MHTISEIYNGKELVTSKASIKTVFVVSFVIMTALGAYVRVPLPFTPVPITLQTFFVILCGALLGKRLGTFTQISYVLLGGLGMPIFQGYAGGFLHILGPTGGYLIGFIAASFVTGALINKCRPIVAMSLGLLSIYVCGIAWLIVGYKFTPANAISAGFIPFIPGAAAKLVAAAWIYSKVHPRSNLLLNK